MLNDQRHFIELQQYCPHPVWRSGKLRFCCSSSAASHLILISRYLERVCEGFEQAGMLVFRNNAWPLIYTPSYFYICGIRVYRNCLQKLFTFLKRSRWSNSRGLPGFFWYERAQHSLIEQELVYILCTYSVHVLYSWIHKMYTRCTQDVHKLQPVYFGIGVNSQLFRLDLRAVSVGFYQQADAVLNPPVLKVSNCKGWASPGIMII